MKYSNLAAWMPECRSRGAEMAQTLLKKLRQPCEAHRQVQAVLRDSEMMTRFVPPHGLEPQP